MKRSLVARTVACALWLIAPAGLAQGIETPFDHYAYVGALVIADLGMVDALTFRVPGCGSVPSADLHRFRWAMRFAMHGVPSVAGQTDTSFTWPPAGAEVDPPGLGGGGIDRWVEPALIDCLLFEEIDDLVDSASCPRNFGTVYLCGGARTGGTVVSTSLALWPSQFLDRAFDRPATPISALEVVALARTDGAVVCSGTLIAPTLVLTAAHCFAEGAARIGSSRSTEDPGVAVALHNANLPRPGTNEAAIVDVRYPGKQVARDAASGIDGAATVGADVDVPELDLALAVLAAPLGGPHAPVAMTDLGSRVDGCVLERHANPVARDDCSVPVAVGYGYGSAPFGTPIREGERGVKRFGFVEVVAYIRRDSNVPADDRCPQCTDLHHYFVATVDDVQVCNHDSGGALLLPGPAAGSPPVLVAVITHLRSGTVCRLGSAFLRVDVPAIGAWIQAEIDRLTPLQ